MKTEASLPAVLIVEDDPDERMLIKDAFEECGLSEGLDFVKDGEELMDYLFQHDGHANPARSLHPDLILLDLSMPKKDGFEALKEIKSMPSLKHIPVVVLTNSEAEEDIRRAYDLGAKSFVTKPTTFEELVDVVRNLSQYWSQTTQPPPRASVRRLDWITIA